MDCDFKEHLHKLICIYLRHLRKALKKNQCEDKVNCSLRSVVLGNFGMIEKVLRNVFFSILSIYTIV